MAEAFVSDRRLYLTGPVEDPESQVVEEGNENARFLLVGEGGTVPAAVAERFHLLTRRVETTPDLPEAPKPGKVRDLDGLVQPEPATDLDKQNPGRALALEDTPADAAPRVRVEAPSRSAEDKAVSGPDSGAKK